MKPSFYCLLAVGGSLSLGSPALAQDIMLNGKICNDFCQTWMGVKPVQSAAVIQPPRAVEVPRQRREDYAKLDPAPIEVDRHYAPPAPIESDAPAHVRRPAAKPLVRAVSGGAGAGLPGGTMARTIDAPRRQNSADLEMEPGLKGLPRLRELVAFPQAIMIETASDRAIRQAQLSQLLKSTTRPKQAKTSVPSVEAAQAGDPAEPTAAALHIESRPPSSTP